MTEFKVGDKVRVLRDNPNSAIVTYGDVGTIKELCDDDDYLVDMVGNTSWWFLPEDIEQVEGDS